jgi:polyhydroxybutyrate depolymerase
MKEKIVGIFVCMLLIIGALPCLGATIEKKFIGSTTLDNHQVLNKERIFKNTEKQVLEHQTKRIFHHLLLRTYLLYVPLSYDGTAPVPLVVMLHGAHNTALNASGRYGVSEKAEEEGFIVVYPDASAILTDMWHIGHGLYTSSTFDELGRLWVDDIGFIKKIIARMQKNYNIDPKRIYIAGNSNGATMAYRLAAELSDTVAAIASNGGCIGGHVENVSMYTIPDPAHPVSIVEFHGKLDTIVPYNGGWNYDHTVFYKSVAEAVSFWLEHNGCNPEPNTTVIGNVTIDRYSGGAAGTEVFLYTVKNKGHVWFGGQPWEDPNPEISTTDEMWQFFETHPKQ